MDEELKDTTNNLERKLSTQLIGRIISLSEGLKPYQFLENDSIISSPLSPERGQLLINILYSELNEETLQKIFNKANFTFSDLRNVDFSTHNIDSNARNSAIKNVNLKGSNFSYANLSSCNFNGSNLQSCIFSGANLFGTTFDSADLSFTTFKNLRKEFYNSEFCTFMDAKIEGIEFGDSYIDDIDFQGAVFLTKSWLNSLKKSNIEGYEYFEENYYINFLESHFRFQSDYFEVVKKK